MRARAAAVVTLLVAAVGLPGATVSAAPAAAAPDTQCQVSVGAPLTDTPWAQRRLDFQLAWAVTKGKSVTTGSRVVVAVIDSGVDRRHPQLVGAHYGPGFDVIPGLDRADTRDCDGHGSSVTAVIAAQHIQALPFVGVAPDVTIVPIKQSNTSSDKTGTAAGIAQSIDYAIRVHAQVANISVTVTTPTDELRASVARAAAGNLVIVAAAGNDGQGQNFAAYPAAYSTQFPNVIAVSASDEHDAIGKFADTGNYVTVAAPGVAVEVPAPVRGYKRVDGTSFAAPYVAGTVALVIASHPGITAQQVRNRIEATADRPPATVPDARYGYGIVNPYLAVTAIRDDSVAPASTSPPPPVPARVSAPSADRHQAHVALVVAVVLLGLAVLAGAGAGVLRGGSRSREEPASAA